MANTKVMFSHGCQYKVIEMASGALDIHQGDNISYNSSGYGKASSDTSGETYAGVAMEELKVASGDNSTAGTYKLKIIPAHAGNIVRRKLSATRATALPGTDVYIGLSASSPAANEVALATVSTNAITNNVIVGKVFAFVSTTEADIAI